MKKYEESLGIDFKIIISSFLDNNLAKRDVTVNIEPIEEDNK